MNFRIGNNNNWNKGGHGFPGKGNHYGFDRFPGKGNHYGWYKNGKHNRDDRRFDVNCYKPKCPVVCAPPKYTQPYCPPVQAYCPPVKPYCPPVQTYYPPVNKCVPLCGPPVSIYNKSYC